MPNLDDYDTLTFDCYGTLIDWESGIVAGLVPLIERTDGIDRDRVLQTHAFYESEQQRQTPTMPYRDILAIVYRRLAEEWGMEVGREECLRYGDSVKDWPAFPDSVEALAVLGRHYRLVILSNIDNESFGASNAKLATAFDAVYTAEDVGSYKPAASNFEYMLTMLDRLGVDKTEILHTAESMFHDHAPANRHGLANCWIHRRHDRNGFGATRSPGTMPTYDFRFHSLGAMAEARTAGPPD